jgi:cell wall-associated NlpC family hydrolase
MSASSTGSGQGVEAAALAAVGARFRLHGREPATGFDCVGLVAWALRAAGFEGDVPSGYTLRGGDVAAVGAILDRVLAQAGGEQAGDVLLMRTGPAQLHLGVRVAGGLVHADAGLRRVVLRPGPVAWPVLGAWRLGGN